MHSTRTAIIDLGTNTFHLLVANELKNIIHEEKMPVKMGLGGINLGIITDSGIERTIACLKVFSKKCKDLNVGAIRAFGTSALRNAKNANIIVERAKTEIGIAINIISGEEEARLIYLGVRQAVRLGESKALIIDIGGGSVEFIIANGKEIFWKQSIEVGGQRLLEKFHKHEPILPEEIESLNQYLQEALHSLKEPLGRYQPVAMVGSSGTFETLSDIYCVRKNISNPETPESPLSFEAFKQIYSELIRLTKEERIAMPGMMEWRAEMIVVTCTLINHILQLHSFSEIRVSRYALKEGVLFNGDDQNLK